MIIIIISGWEGDPRQPAVMRTWRKRSPPGMAKDLPCDRACGWRRTGSEELSGSERLFWTAALINGPHAERSPSPSSSNQTHTLLFCVPPDVCLSALLSNLPEVSIPSSFHFLFLKGGSGLGGYDAAILINDRHFDWANHFPATIRLYNH